MVITASYFFTSHFWWKSDGIKELTSYKSPIHYWDSSLLLPPRVINLVYHSAPSSHLNQTLPLIEFALLLASPLQTQGYNNRQSTGHMWILSGFGLDKTQCYFLSTRSLRRSPWWYYCIWVTVIGQVWTLKAPGKAFWGRKRHSRGSSSLPPLQVQCIQTDTTPFSF